MEAKLPTHMLRRVESITFSNATIVEDREGNEIAAFWSPMIANDFINLLSPEQAVLRLREERDSARLKVVALEQEIALLTQERDEAVARLEEKWVPVWTDGEENPIKPEVGRGILRIEEYGTGWRQGSCKYEAPAQLIGWTHWQYFPAPPAPITEENDGI